MQFFPNYLITMTTHIAHTYHTQIVLYLIFTPVYSDITPPLLDTVNLSTYDTQMDHVTGFQTPHVTHPRVSVVWSQPFCIQSIIKTSLSINVGTPKT